MRSLPTASAPSAPGRDIPPPEPPVLRANGQLTSALVGSIHSAVVTMPGEDQLIIDLTGVATVERQGVLSLLRALRWFRKEGRLVAVVTRHHGIIHALTREPERPALLAGSLVSARTRLDRAARAA